jgi:hypothetical protein
LGLACIDLTSQLAELALRRIASLGELQAQDRDADEVYYWNYDAVFFDPFLGPGYEGVPEDPWALTGEQLLDRLEREQKGFVEVDSLFVVPEHQLAAIERSEMVVRKVCGRQHTARNVAESVMCHSGRQAAPEENRLLANAT